MMQMDIQQELAQLSEAACLLTKNTWQVFFITADQAPKTIGLLQQLRASTFGINQGEALAHYNYYDAYHHHVVLWDNAKKTIIGAYRTGLVQQIVTQHGLDKLYANAIFTLPTGFIENHSGLIELSGVFIQPQYQRNYFALLSLWKGVMSVAGHHFTAPSFMGQVYFTPLPPLEVQTRLTNFFIQPEFSLLDASRQPTSSMINNEKCKQLYVQLIKDLMDVNFDGSHPSLIMLKHYLNFPVKCLGQSQKTIFGPGYNVLIFSEIMKDAAVTRNYKMSE